MRDLTTAFVKRHLALAGILVLALAVYGRLLWYGPISWDDPEMVFMNKAVKNFSFVELFDVYVGNYIPVTMIFHAACYKIFGNFAGGHHSLNILLHLVNGILIYVLSDRIFRSGLVSALTAAIFLLHPLQVESVAWIGELKTVVSATFFIWGLIRYLDYSENRKTTEYVAALVLFVLACLSKPSAIIFPLCLSCLPLLKTKKIDPKSIVALIPFFLLSVFFGILTLKSQSADQFINYSHQYPLHQKLALAGLALLKYLLLFLLPVKQSALYPYPELTALNLSAGIIVLILLGSSGYILYRRGKLAVAGTLLFIIVNLALVLQFVPFGEVLYADRYMYIPLAGFGWMLGLILENFRLPFKITVTVITVFFAAFSFSRVPVWKSGISLYEDIIKKYPNQFVALNSAGVESMRMNNDGKALDYFNRAVKAAPRNFKGTYNAGLLFLKMKKPEQAIHSFSKSISLYEYSKSYAGRASAYLMLGKTDLAMEDAYKSISLDNRNPNGFFVLGNCLSEKQQLEEALDSYNRALNLNGEQPDYYFRRAIVYGKLNNFRESLTDLEKCTQLNPFYFEAYYWKGVAKVNLKQNPCEDFKIAARNNYEPAINAFNRFCQ